MSLHEIVSGRWFNENGDLWSFRNETGSLIRQPGYTYIRVDPNLRATNTKDYAGNGMTYSKIENAPTLEEVHIQMKNFVAKYESKITVFLAHNGKAYDFLVWRDALKRINQEMPKYWVLVDTMPFFRYMLQSSGDKNEKPGLDYLCNMFKVKVEKRHDAYDDVKATVEVFLKCVSERSQDVIGFLLEWMERTQLINQPTIKFTCGATQLTVTQGKPMSESILETTNVNK